MCLWSFKDLRFVAYSHKEVYRSLNDLFEYRSACFRHLVGAHNLSRTFYVLLGGLYMYLRNWPEKVEVPRQGASSLQSPQNPGNPSNGLGPMLGVQS